MTTPERFSRMKRGLAALEWGWMGLALLFLPITSLPLLARLAGNATVSPPTLVFTGIFALAWLPIYVFSKKGKLPREVVPLLLFACIAFVASLVAFFLPIPPYKGLLLSSETLSAVLTLIAGVVCYLVFSTWFRAQRQFEFVYLLLNLTGLAIILWCAVQMYVILFRGGDYPVFMNLFQKMVSTHSLTRGAVYGYRLTGFAYEPSWLAHQLNVLYMPYWLAATVSGFSTFRRRLWRISAENVLLVAGFMLILGSLSRIGLLGILIVLSYLFLRVNIGLVGWLKQRLARRSKKRILNSRWAGALIGLGLLLLYGALVFVLIFALSRVDPRMARIFELSQMPNDLFDFAHSVDFAERVGYWSVGWSVFGHYPLLGVGLGNSGFFYSGYVLPRARGLIEMLRLEYQYSYLPNVKNLWVRLLSETGIVGFSFFITWLFVLWNSARALNRQNEKNFRMIGWMGLFVILALVGEGFSVDSFALPYYWISLGLLTAASVMLRHRGVMGEDKNGVSCDSPKRD